MSACWMPGTPWADCRSTRGSTPRPTPTLTRLADLRDLVNGRDSSAYLRTQVQLGRALRESNRLGESEAVLRPALDGLERLFTAEHDACDEARWELARTLQLEGDCAAALPHLRQLAQRGAQGSLSPVCNSPRGLELLVECLRDAGQLDEARQWAEALLDQIDESPEERSRYETLRKSLEGDTQKEQRR
jgi:tetratricopeptide (TPR) repeat protein